METTNNPKEKPTEDENHNNVRVKEESDFDNDYETNLESILRFTRGVQYDEDFYIKTEFKLEEPTNNDENESIPIEEIDNNNRTLFENTNQNAASEIAKILHNHHNEVRIQYYCQCCDFKSTSLSDLKLHSDQHKELPKIGKQVKQGIVTGKKPKNRSNNIVNPKFEKPKDEISKIRKCPYCVYVAKNEEDWNDHRKVKHAKSSIRKCKLCDFVTNSAIRHKLHMNEHSEMLIHKCQYCDYESMQPGHLKRHVNSVHTKSSEFPCRSCDFVSANFDNLKRHMEKVHEQIVITGKLDNQNEPKIFNPERKGLRVAINNKEQSSKRSDRSSKKEQLKCQFCDYRTNFTDYLNIHVNSRHTQSTVYKCDYCEYWATKMYTLRCHVNSKHTKKVLYKCELCNLETTRSNILKRHIERIHQAKSFDCQHCDYVAKKEGHLRNHLRIKHAIKSVREIKEEIVEEFVEIMDVKIEPELVKVECSEETKVEVLT